MRTKQFLKILVLFCLFANTISAQNKPNIVVIMADDIGVGDIGFYHKQRTGKEPVVPTPNIDKLIDQGMRFSDAHSPASLCAPTRFSMMTGNFSYRNKKGPWGVWGPDRDAGIEPNFTTVARVAKKGGYNTAFFGKWGLGGDWDAKPKSISGYENLQKGAGYYGFDYSVALPEGIQNVPYAFYEDGKFMKLKADSKITKIPFEQLKYSDENKRKVGGSVGDSNWDPALTGPILANKVVSYINQQSNNKKPFFLYYCSQAVHVPHTPSSTLNGEKISGSTLENHGDMIKELDAQVGMMIAALKKNNLYDNTLIVFTSDNGGLSNSKHSPLLEKAGHDSSDGKNGYKGSIYEGGHRIPFVAVWSGHIKPKSESDIVMVGHDVMPTIAAVTNVSLEKEEVLDAANLLPILTGKSEAPIHKYLMHQAQKGKGGYYAIREGDFKLVMSVTKRDVFDDLKVDGLYNLKDNVLEDPSGNLKEKEVYKEKISQLKNKFLALRKPGASTLY
ncbi:arylsulfatase [Polaribacter sp. Z014]|uniref:sulfatase family protein n=1 Tax=Polaribacter sp. Z014 TaxID=2927126 RepID=UPI0020220EB2|nr:arylsulfatase [Polaribacter sp. Z014]MCL7763987.1 arylsulfatase [Polaribacter sp. Z014]